MGSRRELAPVQPSVQADPLTSSPDPAPRPTLEGFEDDAALYVHIPFCRVRCPYCDFATAPYRKKTAERYVEAVGVEAAAVSSRLGKHRFATVFLGGGTPSRLEPSALETLMASVYDAFVFSPRVEVTLEANPEDVVDDRVRAWSGVGVNRVSLGIQSLDARELETLGRVHDADQATNAARGVARAFPTWSLDLMYGFPGHGTLSWERTLERALALQPPHLSLYQFTAEAGTTMGDAVRSGRVAAADDDAGAELYEIGERRCEAAGLEHYEISNYARPGHRSKHNLYYWHRRPYLGLGPGAVSQWGSRRWKNERRTDRYLEEVLEGGAWVAETEDLHGKEALEIAMLGLRLVEGVRASRFQEEAGADAALWRRAAEALASEGWLVYEDERIRVPRERRRLTDSIVLRWWERVEALRAEASS